MKDRADGEGGRFVVRLETARDAPTIAGLVTAAFAQAPHRDGTEAAIVERLRQAGALTLSLVAVVEAEIVGHAAFSPVRIGGRDLGWSGLGPLSVSPDLRRRGIGAALVEQGLARLRDGGGSGCVVLGDPAYYGRFGFATDPRLRLPGAPAWAFQRLAFGADAPTAEVAYHAAFGGGA